MLTPQKVWSSWLSPREDKNGSGSRNSDPKDKGLMIGDSTPKGLFSNVGTMDRDVVTDKINKLEKELYEYQYNMGVLLLEKKEWIIQNEQFEETLAETKEQLKREQTAHLIAIAEVEKREEKLRKALGVEKQCVHELEKALREMRSEYAEIKFTADSKLEEAQALSTSIEGRSMEVEAKLRAADAKLAEVSRKSSELQRKSNEIEAKESSLLRERMSFNNERDAHERNLCHQREDLREWEKKLQEGEEKLAELRRLLNQREELANDSDRIFKQKQLDLEETQKRVDIANSDLKIKEEEISSRIENLASKEKEAAATKKKLEVKEKELLKLEEKLNVREKVEIQRLLDEHKVVLDAKTRDFELELEQKRKSLDEEFKVRVAEVEKKEVEVKHLEGKIVKREQALENKLEKFKEKEKDFEMKSKALKEKEKSIKIEEKNLEKERKEVKSETENLLSLKGELEKINAEIEEQRAKVNEEREKLRVTEDERREHVRLQTELKRELEKVREETEGIMMERENLKAEREKFEKEWEDLDVKRDEIKKELEYFAAQKEHVEKMNRLEEEKLNNLRLETESYVARELEALKLSKESFDANMEHEKSVLEEKYRSKESEMVREFEVKKRELETELRTKEAELKNRMSEREKSFNEENERVLANVKYLKDIASREMEEMKLERVRLEKEKNGIFTNQKHLEGQQLEMKNDIDQLVSLSVKLKEQREQFFKERERFVSFVEKQKSCNECGEKVSEFILSDLQSLSEIKSLDTFTFPKLADGYLKEAGQGTSVGPNIGTSTGLGNSGSPGSGSKTFEWLRKCTSKVFIFSAGKKDEDGSGETQAQEKLVDVGEIPEYILSSEDEPEHEHEPEVSAKVVVSDSFDVQVDQSGGDDPRNVDNNTHEIEEGSKKADGNEGPSQPITRRRLRATKARAAKATSQSESANGVVGPSDYTNEVSQGVSKGGRKGGRKRASEQEPGNSEQSGSVATGARRNTKQKVTKDVEAPPVRRYNLRHTKNGAPMGDGRTLSNQSKDDGVSKGAGRKRRVTGSKVQPEASTSHANGDNTGDSHPHTKDVDEENEVGNKCSDDIVMSEEVNGTPQQDREQHHDDDEIGTPAGSNDDDDDDDNEDDADDEEEEVEHPGEVSIGRKLWTFIST
ncbi:nuclear matrix constituent protein 1-like [Rutidosis leptorrhynchoides]|uniref:nuclear matrix constituent protein 1-like n=1 Tax=Rutidosis leptorrhynchoides TaxID=125765 RepID=UPI003A9A20F9